ncbi:MAG: helix-turn-helix domain-containing protein [Candidatus Woesearchaeota archaeon]|jgi:sugar-specific transcriptional regulator TrmB
MIKIEETLENISFSKNEIKIYLKLLELGSSKAGKIAKETKLDRSSTYNALTNLLNKGFISYVNIANVKWFQPISPKRILEYINEQKENVKDILPQLEGTYKQTKLKGQVTLHKGLKGVETVFRDILRNADENLIFGSEGQFRNRMPYFYEHFVREQKEKNIQTKILVRVGRKDYYKEGNYRFIDNDIESPVVTNIYKDKIAIIVWTDEPEAIIIENKDAADSYRAYFEFMWKNAIKKQT